MQYFGKGYKIVLNNIKQGLWERVSKLSYLTGK